MLQNILPDLVLIQVAAQELDGRSQALLKGVLGRPAGQLTQLGGIAQQAVDLALFGAQTLGLADDLGVRVDLGDQLIGRSPMECSTPVAMFSSWPIAASQSAIVIKPLAVSLT